jgi:hypothetical protein
MNCASVDISTNGISQLDGKKTINTIPREGIVRITLSHDSCSRHPFLRFLVGFVMIAMGIVLGIGAFLLDLGGIYPVETEYVSFGIPVAPLVIVSLIWAGGWLLAGMLRGRYNLLIHTPNGIRKIFFTDSADIRDIRQFLRRAQTELGYEIDVSLMDQMHF